MSIAYCIAAHGHQRETTRLLARLLGDDPEAVAIVHYDSRQGALSLDGLDRRRVELVPEKTVHWGGPELLEVTLEMLRRALDGGHTYAVLLSGQDYPLRHVANLEEDLCPYDVWADLVLVMAPDGSTSWTEGRRRYGRQWVRLTTTEVPLWLRKLNRLGVRSGVLPVSDHRWPGQLLCSYYQTDQQLWWGRRSKGPGVPLYGGSNWMNLSRSAMSAVTSAPSSLLSYFRRVPMPSEAFFHTVLANTTGLTFAPGHARYIKMPPDVSHPETLTSGDLDDMRASGAHFARKFDMSVDGEVYDRLDELAALGQFA